MDFNPFSTQTTKFSHTNCLLTEPLSQGPLNELSLAQIGPEYLTTSFLLLSLQSISIC